MSAAWGVVTPSELSTSLQGELEPDDVPVLERKPQLSRLLDLATFTELCRNFVELYRIGLKVFDDKGRRLIDLPIGNPDFCGYVFRFGSGQRGCTSTVARVKNGPVEPTQGARMPGTHDVPRGTVAVPCFTGLRYLVVPLVHEHEVLGRIVYGPFWPDDMAQLPESLSALLGPGFDRDEAWNHLQKVRRVGEGTVGKVLVQFAKMVEALVVSGHKSWLTAQLHIEATRESYRELQQKNRELAENNARLQELDRLKSAFLATVSHELRTPLTSIIGYSEMLTSGLAGPLQPDQEEYLRIIMEKGETLLGLITSLLDLTQIEAGKLRMLLAPSDINGVVKGALESVAPQFQKKGVALMASTGPLARPPLVDREKLRQCLVNLLSNALKFTAAGGEVRVAVKAGALVRGQEGFAISVEDDGLGIAPEHQKLVFERFFQVDHSSTRAFGGAGLGLAIVRSYVDAHGGEVELDSSVGKGSRFTLLLPYAPAEPTAPTAAAELPARPSPFG